MADLGSRYPPGVSSPPYDEEQFCEICGLFEYRCKCPKCPVCDEVGIRSCAGKEGHLPYLKPSVLCLEHLCELIGISLGPNGYVKNLTEAESAIDRFLFSGSTHGITFSLYSNPIKGILGVSVGGFFEGLEDVLKPYILLFPFTPEQFWEAVDEANADSVHAWNVTHGCDECARLWGGFDPVDGFACRGYDGATMVNPDCQKCGGNGADLDDYLKDDEA